MSFNKNILPEHIQRANIRRLKDLTNDDYMFELKKIKTFQLGLLQHDFILELIDNSNWQKMKSVNAEEAYSIFASEKHEIPIPVEIIHKEETKTIIHTLF